MFLLKIQRFFITSILNNLTVISRFSFYFLRSYICSLLLSNWLHYVTFLCAYCFVPRNSLPISHTYYISRIDFNNETMKLKKLMQVILQHVAQTATTWMIVRFVTSIATTSSASNYEGYNFRNRSNILLNFGKYLHFTWYIIQYLE